MHIYVCIIYINFYIFIFCWMLQKTTNVRDKGLWGFILEADNHIYLTCVWFLFHQDSSKLLFFFNHIFCSCLTVERTHKLR